MKIDQGNNDATRVKRCARHMPRLRCSFLKNKNIANITVNMHVNMYKQK